MSFFTKMILSLMLIPITASAAQVKKDSLKIQIKAKISMSGDLQDEVDDETLKSQGWTWRLNDDEQREYLFEKQLEVKDLPVNYQIGSAKLSISKSGRLVSAISVGDSDAGADAELQLPIDLKGHFLPLPKLSLKNGGGDYASGSWSYQSEVEVSVQ